MSGKVAESSLKTNRIEIMFLPSADLDPEAKNRRPHGRGVARRVGRPDHGAHVIAHRRASSDPAEDDQRVFQVYRDALHGSVTDV
jgi:hypothetical protein